ncbi:MAG TPA: hypothetical protein VG538_06005 [Vicinamibacterales bacterium]|jgi:hypothetical protein|nr:hypothetical protein [Vicinamibacterales bacterium]
MTNESTKWPYVVRQDNAACDECGAGAYWSVVFALEDVALSTSFEDRDEAEHRAHEVNEAYRRGKEAAMTASAESARRLEDLRVALIRAINTALAHAGVELPASAAATVEPTATVWTPEFAAAFDASTPTDEQRLTATVEGCRAQLEAERELHREEMAAITAERAALADYLQDGETVVECVKRIAAERDRWRAEVGSAQSARAEATSRAEGLEVERDRYRRAVDELITRINRAERSAADEKRLGDDARRALADATRWRPMSEAKAGAEVVMCGRFGCQTTTNAGHYAESPGAFGWLPLPPLPTAPVTETTPAAPPDPNVFTATVRAASTVIPREDAGADAPSDDLEPTGYEELKNRSAEVIDRIWHRYPTCTAPWTSLCSSMSHGFVCTRKGNHAGPHVAYGARPFAWWPNHPAPEAK